MQKEFCDFGTYNFINIGTEMPDEDQRQLLTDMQETCDRFDDMFSVFKPESEVSAINRNAGIAPVTVSSMVLHLLGEAAKIYRETGGAFDPTICPAVELWKVGQADERVPQADELSRVKELVDCSQLEIGRVNSTAFLRRRGQSLDFGGIAKGYAGDIVRNELIKRGVDSALINFGGTILTIGNKPDGSSWRVGIQNPLGKRGRSVGSVPLADGALVTSGVNERFFIKDGVRYHHLLDPRTCMTARSGVLSVTAAGSSAAMLDGLTTAMFVMGPQEGIPLAVRLGVDVLYLTENAEIIATEGFASGRYQFRAAN